MALGRRDSGSPRGQAGLLTEVEARIDQVARDLSGRIDELAGAVADARLRADVIHESVLLAEASRLVPKEPHVVLVEAPAQYGNVTALARTLTAELGPDRVAVLARDADSERAWRAEGVTAYAWTTAPDSGAAPAWRFALTAAVSVVEHHLWWREPDRAVLRGLLAGSATVQLWHNASAGYGKEVALVWVPEAEGMAQFADVVTTSVGYAAFVREPRDAAAREHEFQAATWVSDVHVRMVGPLRRAATRPARPDGPPRVLVAPTYPESPRGAQALAERLRTYRDAARSSDAEVVVRLHPWSPDVVHQAVDGLTVMPNEVDLYDTLETFDVLVTDFSSLASDVLLLGRRVVLDHTDAAGYVEERGLRRNEDVLACCDVADTPRDAIQLALDPGSDTRADLRAAHARERLDALGAEAGANTLDAIRALLDTAAR